MREMLKRWGLWVLLVLAFPIGVLIAFLRGRRTGVTEGAAKEKLHETLDAIKRADADQLHDMLVGRKRKGN